MNYGQAIKYIRTEVLKVTQKDLAHDLGITDIHLSVLENDRGKPSVQLLDTLSGLAKMPLSDIFKIVENK